MSRLVEAPPGKEGPSFARPYHHGNLRPALVRAAVKVLLEEGFERLSLRRVARRAGVSHMAPYHHFADKRALLAAVAAAGFRDLRQAMLERMSAVEGSPGRRLQESAVAAVVFAARRPDHYRLMFGPVLADRSAFPELEEAARSAFEVILEGLGGTDVSAVGGEAVHKIGTAAWAMVHGLAILLIDGQLEATVDDDVERTARDATDLLWAGLGSLGRER